MKTIKTPEEIYREALEKHNLSQPNYVLIIDAIKSYHAQYEGQSLDSLIERVEKNCQNGVDLAGREFRYIEFNDVIETLRTTPCIKAKALRKKGTNRYYWYLWGSFIEADVILPFNEDLYNRVMDKLPADAELIDIQILIP